MDVGDGELVAEAALERQLRFIHEDLKLRLGGRYLRKARSDPGLLSFFPNNSWVYARLQLDF